MPKYLVEDAKELSKNCNIKILLKELNLDRCGWAGKEIVKFQNKYLNSLDINILKSSRINYLYPKILKKEILSQLMQGIGMSDLAKKFNMPLSTISTWNRKKPSKKYKNQINIKLLQDIYNIFEINKIGKISTLNLISDLCKDRHWSNYNSNIQNKKIKPNQLYNLLAPCNIRSKSMSFHGIHGEKTSWKKGYEKNQFKEIWKTHNISKSNGLSFHTDVNDHCLVPSLESFPESACLTVANVPSPGEFIPLASSKKLNLKDFKEYLQKFDNVKYENGVFYINNIKEENTVTTLKEKKVTTKNKLKSPETDNYIFITKFICSLIISLFFFKLSYFEMLSIFSISYGFFSIIEYFLLENFHKNSKKDLSP